MSAPHTVIPRPDLEQKRQAARLVMLSLDAFYTVFARVRPDLVDVIAGRIGHPNSETQDCVMCGDTAGSVTGVFASYPSALMRTLQIQDTRALMRDLDRSQRNDVQAQLATLSARIAKVQGDSYYLSRIAVSPRCRGNGTADHLIELFQHKAREFEKLSLHVHCDNDRAIAFYTRHGFEPITTDSNLDYILMEKPNN